MTDYHINIFYSREDRGYIADIPDLRACSAFGATPEEALAEVETAKTAWLAAARETGKRVRRPSRSLRGGSALRSGSPRKSPRKSPCGGGPLGARQGRR